jgi:2-polyprenyl-6-hydroxyphenyl methylase/3-demethylubiquinone-9 3-methyltransferase
MQSGELSSLTFDDYIKLFEEHGGTDENYLNKHFLRFHNTYLRFASSHKQSESQSVVDVGAHWLHQALLYALAGHQVEAFNLPTTFKKGKVKSLASAYNIKLTGAEDLQSGACFTDIPESSVDLVLFTEILEHITFNPVIFWQCVYRIMKPGARILLTTPNYYGLLGRAWNFRRFLGGFGGGLPVGEVLMQNTYSHHWKEFSMKEVAHYFALLSSDFSCVKCEYTDDRSLDEKGKSPVREFLMRQFEFLKPNLHIEIELTKKECGISLKPAWARASKGE